MRLMCSGCGRQVGAGRYYRTGDTCGAEVVTRPALIARIKGRALWVARRVEKCTGLLLKGSK
jgi:hypothetical protein